MSNKMLLFVGDYAVGKKYPSYSGLNMHKCSIKNIYSWQGWKNGKDKLREMKETVGLKVNCPFLFFSILNLEGYNKSIM